MDWTRKVRASWGLETSQGEAGDKLNRVGGEWSDGCECAD